MGENEDNGLPGEPDVAGDGADPRELTAEDRRRIMAADQIMRMYAASATKPVDYFADFGTAMDRAAQAEGHIPEGFDLAAHCGWEPDPVPGNPISSSSPLIDVYPKTPSRSFPARGAVRDSGTTST